ncbi:hypothetical protein [Treponema phagedenis]|nr:hypothetical protein [Treponema phagedenis]
MQNVRNVYGPLEMSKPWSTQGLIGIYRFLEKVWRSPKSPLPTKRAAMR